MKGFCHKCNKIVNAVVRKVPEQYRVLGKPIRIIAEVAHCAECKQSFFHFTLDEANLKKAYIFYEQKYGESVEVARKKLHPPTAKVCNTLKKQSWA